MSNHRFPYDEQEHATSKQFIHDALKEMHPDGVPFDWTTEDGSSLLGCYAPLSYNPAFLRQFFQMARTLYAPGTVRPRHRELAIFGLASVLPSPYVAYCHRRVGSHCGLDSAQVDDALAGRVPAGLEDAEVAAYRLGRHLADLRAPLDDDTWRDAVRLLGKQELVGITHAVAGYRWVSMLDYINAGDDCLQKPGSEEK